MAGFNRVILMGNLTRDPELRQTPSGSQVAEMRLAISEKYRNRQSGELAEVTCFVDIVAWERQAELCGQYLAKGRPILVEGRLQLDEWKNDKGENRSRLRVRADRVTFLSSGQRSDGASGDDGMGMDGTGSDHATSAPPTSVAPPAPAVGTAAPEGPEAGDDDDLPF